MAPWMVPGGTNYSAVDSPGGPLLGGTTYSMTHPVCTQYVLILSMDHYTDVTGTGADHVITASRLMLPSLHPQSHCWQICSLLEKDFV